MGMEEGSELMGNGEGGQNSWVMEEGSELMGNGGGVRTHGKWNFFPQPSNLFHKDGSNYISL